LISSAAQFRLPAAAARAGYQGLVSPFHRLDGGDAYTFVMVGVIGVLLLGAHHADEAGRRRFALALLGSTVAALVGPLAVLGILLVAAWYAVFLGLPVLAVVLVVRHIRRRRTLP
jgi:hypothetical protein